MRRVALLAGALALGSGGFSEPVASPPLASAACYPAWETPRSVGVRITLPQLLGRTASGLGPWVFGNGAGNQAGRWADLLVHDAEGPVPPPARQGAMLTILPGPEGRPIAIWATPTEGFGDRRPARIRSSPALIQARVWNDGEWGEVEEVFRAGRLRFHTIPMRSTAVTNQGGVVHYIRTLEQDDAESRFVLLRSADGSWERQGPLASSPPGHLHHLEADGERLLRLSRGANLGPPSPTGGVFLQWSLDGGASWPETRHVLEDDGSPFQAPVLFRTEGGALHVVASRRANAGGELMHEVWHSVSRDGGDSWAPRRRILVTPRPVRLPPILLEDPRGGVHAFVGSGGTDASWVRMRWDGGAWSPPESVLEGIGSPPVDGLVAAGADQTLVASFAAFGQTFLVQGRWACGEVEGGS